MNINDIFTLGPIKKELPGKIKNSQGNKNYISKYDNGHIQSIY